MSKSQKSQKHTHHGSKLRERFVNPPSYIAEFFRPPSRGRPRGSQKHATEKDKAIVFYWICISWLFYGISAHCSWLKKHPEKIPDFADMMKLDKDVLNAIAKGQVFEAAREEVKRRCECSPRTLDAARRRVRLADDFLEWFMQSFRDFLREVIIPLGLKFSQRSKKYKYLPIPGIPRFPLSLHGAISTIRSYLEETRRRRQRV